MEQPQIGTMKIPGITLAGDEFSQGDIQFNTQNDESVSGFGQPVSLAASQKMIRNFQSDLLLEFVNGDDETKQAVASRPIAITLGKESLLFILSQNECEGIRFYFCKNHLQSPSIIAVGVKNNIVDDPNATLASRARDLGTVGDKLSILSRDVQINNVVEDFFYYEVGPPTTLEDVFDAPIGVEVSGFEGELNEVLSNLN
ncbi:hypothetical protein EXU85_30060 [Spirosoma sp. KCTC 42546]|uniref:hypothetical protein n=1 Tax=Spirosoma sp. KCTC 42546 TaxID=2520506 RepID=UPI00115BBA90|nr:hypothetical protein [Spirosoma sp. KCTC 42546]QDK82625.1 hypothetical protein EXU85_30060 [Spirosoma sp. KCTC 42546]